MIIWGFRWVRTRIGQTGRALYCKKCGYSGIWAILTRIRYFTLFFIQLFPTRRQVVVGCPHCGVIFAIKEEELEAYKAGTAVIFGAPKEAQAVGIHSGTQADSQAIQAPKLDAPQAPQTSKTPQAVAHASWSLSKTFALIGMILKSLFVFVLFALIVIGEVRSSSVMQDFQPSDLLAFLVIILIIFIALFIMGRVAFAKMGTKKRTGWHIYLLIYGILSCTLIIGVTPVFLSEVASGVLLILAFAFANRKSKR
ncbi:MAG: zinc ribbon domain-containing protein [Streptococcaceae bacterium]|jgi:hypothetical protein|nr:zinc ribbon domain-containing protein [Streptococcaceae bacterium]